ncbi:MAG: TolC family protein [Candidatus Omnitrophica bacterium]|nr:TolC family protein [Candidatus Omnitrophota bacterium]
MKYILRTIIIGILCVALAATAPHANAQNEGKQSRVISLEEFIRLATEHDTAFEKILIDELSLQYLKDINLPARDIILAIKEEYDMILNQEREEEETSISLSKLFPYTGTEISAAYETTPSYTASQNSSDATLSITQPIARNAFGRATRLHDKIIGLEIDVAKHQIVEAYEDYLATIVTAYYTWWEAYQNMLISESSYTENLKLLDNMKERQKSKIALPIDVNKTHLQVLAKKEKLIALRDAYDEACTVITTAMRYDTEALPHRGEVLLPVEPHQYERVNVLFDEDFKKLTDEGRTFQVLKLLEEKSSLDVAKNADDLLPSIDLVFAYNIKGGDYTFKDGENMFYGAISIEYPFPDQVDRAEYETSKITEKKTKLSTDNVYHQLYRDLRNVSFAITREKNLLAIADEKIALAQDVLDAEIENYTYGKVTLNDYIAAVNNVDTQSFNKITRATQLKKLTIEWLRLTDRLIARNEIREPKAATPSTAPVA